MTLPEIPPAFAWAHAYPPIAATATIRTEPEDFFVEERLGFEADGAGEHAFLIVEKRNANTADVARLLASHAGVKGRDVSYAGLKDRNAVTRQAFTVHLPGRPDPDWNALNRDGVVILQASRHSRKLRRGALRGNRFRLCLRGLEPIFRAELEERLVLIAERGVPNYFGEQRFGRNNGNLAMAARLFSGARRERDRTKRGLYLSAARSYLFNRELEQRIHAGCWKSVIEGDRLILDGRRPTFPSEEMTPEDDERLAKGAIHPAGLLWGRGKDEGASEAQALREAAHADCGLWRAGLEQAGLEREWRALRVIPREVVWQWPSDDQLELEFFLNSGSYATAVLAELCRVVDASRGERGELRR